MRFVLHRKVVAISLKSLRLAALLLALPTYFSLNSSLAQIDTTLRGYFPTHVGDLWEYEENNLN